MQLREITNIVVAGLGGQGVIKASDIIADAAFRAGFDVKKSEIHGMSQRGGSVTSDVRFGRRVHSPMIVPGEAHYLLVLAPDQIENNRHLLSPDGVLLAPDWIDAKELANPRSINVALIGALSRFLTIDQSIWLESIQAALPERLHDANRKAFAAGCRSSGTLRTQS